MTTHLVPTPEAFAEQIRARHGAGAVLHPSNRMTACGKRMGELSVTTSPERVTCKTCQRAGGGA